MLTEFCVHSKFSCAFLWLAGMFCSCAKLSGCIRSEEISNGTALLQGTDFTSVWL